MTCYPTVPPGDLLLRHRHYVNDDPSVPHLWRTYRSVLADGAVRRLFYQHHGPHRLRAGRSRGRFTGHRLPAGPDVRAHDRGTAHRR